jgi:glycosyltransferase involved in cell wall biosynthesis
VDQLRTGEQGDYVFYPSRLEPQKRQELLIAAMRFVTTPVKVIFAGGSADAKHYETLIKQNCVADRVVMRGFVSEDELVQLYGNALGVCYLPFDEDYGYVTLEGMLAGKPLVVTSDGGGATEFIEHDAEGLVVEPEPRSIAAALDTLYADRARAQTMGERGCEKIKSMNLSWDNVVKRLIEAAE